MGKRATRRRQDQDQDFTDAKRAAMSFSPVQVTERGQVVGKTQRRLCPAMRWGWLSERERAALVRYWELDQEAGVPVRGCLTPPTGGGPSGALRAAMKRDELDKLRRSCSGTALVDTDALLLGDNPPDLDEYAVGKYGAPREAARLTVRAYVGISAREMAKWFGA